MVWALGALCQLLQTVENRLFCRVYTLPQLLWVKFKESGFMLALPCRGGLFAFSVNSFSAPYSLFPELLVNVRYRTIRKQSLKWG